MRYRSADNVVAELRSLHNKYGVDLFVPIDDLFIANKKVALELLDKMKNADIPNVEYQFPQGLNVNTLDEEVINALVDMGMKVIFLAIESGSEYVQKWIIKKRVNLEKAKRLVHYMQGKGVMVRCFFILGFPGETVEQMEHTVAFAKDMEADWCVIFVASPLRGSDMYDIVTGMGYLDDDVSLWDGRILYDRKYDTPEISAEALNVFCERANLEISYINNRSLLHGEFDKALGIFRDIIAKFPYHIIARHCLAKSYDGLGMKKEAMLEREEIGRLMKNDIRAIEMYRKHGDLIENAVS